MQLFIKIYLQQQQQIIIIIIKVLKYNLIVEIAVTYQNYTTVGSVSALISVLKEQLKFSVKLFSTELQKQCCLELPK
jgi:hypothetical protein